MTETSVPYVRPHMHLSTSQLLYPTNLFLSLSLSYCLIKADSLSLSFSLSEWVMSEWWVIHRFTSVFPVVSRPCPMFLFLTSFILSLLISAFYIHPSLSLSLSPDSSFLLLHGTFIVISVKPMLIVSQQTKLKISAVCLWASFTRTHLALTRPQP